MFKKLVKYGNSNALILDRAILELLNISEGAVVKLHTDGKSLTITPQDPVEAKEVSMGGMEMLTHLIDTKVEEETALIKADPIKSEQMDQWMPGSDNGAKLAQMYKTIMEKYQDDLIVTASEPFLHAVDALAEKYHNDKTSPDFIKEFFVLRIQYAPNLANMDKEMAEVPKILGMPDYL